MTPIFSPPTIPQIYYIYKSLKNTWKTFLWDEDCLTHFCFVFLFLFFPLYTSSNKVEDKNIYYSEEDNFFLMTKKEWWINNLVYNISSIFLLSYNKKKKKKKVQWSWVNLSSAIRGRNQRDKFRRERRPLWKCAQRTQGVAASGLSALGGVSHCNWPEVMGSPEPLIFIRARDDLRSDQPGHYP